MKLSKRLKLGIAAGAALTFGAVNAAPSYAVHQTVTGLTTSNQIVQFAVGTPGTLINGTPTTVTFPGGATDTDLIGLDYRPRGGNLFAQASGGTVYVLEPNTALAGTVTATRVTGAVADGFTAAPTSFGFDFNPQVDRIRVTNDAPSGTSDNNYRYNPNNGQRVLIDGDLDYSTGDAERRGRPERRRIGVHEQFRRHHVDRSVRHRLRPRHPGAPDQPERRRAVDGRPARCGRDRQRRIRHRAGHRQSRTPRSRSRATPSRRSTASTS